jgi:hypothetical protein
MSRFQDNSRLLARELAPALIGLDVLCGLAHHTAEQLRRNIKHIRLIATALCFGVFMLRSDVICSKLAAGSSDSATA